MGKLHSKHACKRRENPEGDSFVVNGFISRRGVEEGERYGTSGTNLKDYKELQDCELKDGHRCPLQVILPPEKAEGCERFLQYLPAEDGERDLKETCKGKKRISLNDLECNVSLVDDNRQEWVFTLYDFDNSGKVTKEDMSSLMNTIYDVVDASVNHSCKSKQKTLRVKLTVSPEPGVRRRDGTHAGTEKDASRLSRIESAHTEERRQHTHIRGQADEAHERNHYCVDENTERRNHYLDLAGIENYTSRFDSTSPPAAQQEPPSRHPHNQSRSRSHESETQAHQRRSQVMSDHCVALDPRVRNGPQFIRSPKGTSKGAAGGQAAAKISKCHGYYPSMQVSAAQDVYHLPQQNQPQAPSGHQHPLQHSHSKRVRAKAREQALSPSKQPSPAPDREQNAGFMRPVVQRHEHHHHHEHYHHHHYHHYHQT